MSSHGHLNPFASPFGARGATILIEIVIAALVVLAFGKIQLSAKRQQRRWIDVRRDLILHGDGCGATRLRACRKDYAVAIKITPATLYFEVQRANLDVGRAEVHAIV